MPGATAVARHGCARQCHGGRSVLVSIALAVSVRHYLSPGDWRRLDKVCDAGSDVVEKKKVGHPAYVFCITSRAT